MANRLAQLRDVLAGRFDAAEAFASPPTTNGNGTKAHGAPLELEAKGVTINGAQWHSPDGMRTIIRLDGSLSSEAERVSQATAYHVAHLCYAAISYRAKKLSEPPLYVAEEDDEGGEEWLPDHPLAPLLEDPSPDFDMGELLQRTVIAVDTTGACIWVKDPTRAGGLGRLTPFSGAEFEVRSTDTRIRGLFRVRVAGGTREFTPDQVVYFHEPNPDDWHRGLSRVDVLLGQLNLGQTTDYMIREVMRNAVVAPLVFTAPAEWSPTEEELERWHRGIDSYGKTKGKSIGLTGGVTVTQLGANLKNMIPGDVLDRVESAVASVFGVPAVILQFLTGMENSPWSQMAEARRMCYEDTIEPLWREFEKRMTRQLLRAPIETGRQPLDDDPSHFVRFDVTKVRALQPDKAILTTIANEQREFATVGERRQLVGLEPFGDERDEVVTGVVVAAVPPTGESTSDGANRATGKSAVATLAVKSADRDAAWARFDLLTKAQEAGWESVIAAQLKADQRLVLAAFDETKAPPIGPADPEKVRKLIEQLTATLAMDRSWSDRVTPLTESTAKTAVRELAAELGVGFDVAIPGLDAFVQREAAWLVTQVSTTTKAAIRDALEAGLREGESVVDLRKRLEGDGFDGMFSRARAELIARTESTRVTNGAQLEATEAVARELGVPATKTWLATRDGRVRDSHLSIDGETVALDDVFSNGRSAPGEPNCRCTLTYSLEGA